MSRITIPLSVKTDEYGDEFYTAKTTKTITLNGATTFTVHHPEEDGAEALLFIDFHGPDKGRSFDDLMLKEIARASERFSDGYVGLGMFLNNWKARAKAFPRGHEARKEIIDRLMASGKVEVYTADDGKEAIRLAA